MDLAAIIMARLGLDKTPFNTGLKEAGAELQGFAGSMLKLPNLGALVGGAGLAVIGREILENAKHVEFLSERFGVSTTVIQQWGFAAEQAGSNLDAITMGFNRLDVSRDKALKGDEALLEHFHSLGITFTDLQTLSPDELMKKIGSSSLDAADMVAILGRNGTELKPVLEGIANGTIKLGKAVDDIDIKKLAEAEDLLVRISQQGKVTGSGILASILEFPKKLGEKAGDAAGLIYGLGDVMGKVFTGQFSKAKAELLALNEVAKGSSGAFGKSKVDAAADAESKKKKAVEDDENSKLDEKVDKAKDMVDVLKLELAGETQLATALKTRLEFEEKITAAKRSGQNALAAQLQLEEKLTLEKQAQAADLKRLEQVQFSLDELAKLGRGGTQGKPATPGFSSDQPYGYGQGTQAREAQKELELAKKALLNEDIGGALSHRSRAQDIMNQIPGLKESEKDRNPIESSQIMRNLAQDVSAMRQSLAEIDSY